MKVGGREGGREGEERDEREREKWAVRDGEGKKSKF